MNGQGTLVGLVIVESDCTVATITKYSATQDSYYLESSNGRDKGWMQRVMVETGMLSGSIRQAFPIWAALSSPLGSRPGAVIIPSSVTHLPASC